jgi:hypothetical protein
MHWKRCVLAGALTLTACVTPRMHDISEINSVGTRCGLALGEVFQDEEAKKLLFVVRPGVTSAQRACVAQWARRNGLKTVIVDQINFQDL